MPGPKPGVLPITPPGIRRNGTVPVAADPLMRSQAAQTITPGRKLAVRSYRSDFSAPRNRSVAVKRDRAEACAPCCEQKTHFLIAEDRPLGTAAQVPAAPPEGSNRPDTIPEPPHPVKSWIPAGPRGAAPLPAVEPFPPPMTQLARSALVTPYPAGRRRKRVSRTSTKRQRVPTDSPIRTRSVLVRAKLEATGHTLQPSAPTSTKPNSKIADLKIGVSPCGIPAAVGRGGPSWSNTIP